jgi:hypothetical protein
MTPPLFFLLAACGPHGVKYPEDTGLACGDGTHEEDGE